LVIAGMVVWSSHAHGQTGRLLRLTDDELDIVVARLVEKEEMAEYRRERFRQVVGDHRAMVALFTNHGLLGSDELGSKVAEVHRSVEFFLRSVLSPGQLKTVMSLGERPVRQRMTVFAVDPGSGWSEE
jgi:hypothetical protein